MTDAISTANMQAMITRMRMMADQISPDTSSGMPAAQGSSFGESLKASLDKVNELQMVAKDKTTSFELGEDISITEVMLAKEKASIAFEATLQVRNKVLTAYQEIMQMPV
jgi:flagellar hook-basal body complex protein FliE